MDLIVLFVSCGLSELLLLPILSETLVHKILNLSDKIEVKKL